MAPPVTVTRLSRVIMCSTRSAGSVAKRTSRLVRMPTSRPLPGSTTGRPLMRARAMIARTSARVCCGSTVTGLTTMPLSNRLQRRTCSACSSGPRFLWMTPRPPCWAMAMAIASSVTVSLAAAISGMLSPMRRVSRERVSVALGSTCE